MRTGTLPGSPIHSHQEVPLSLGTVETLEEQTKWKRGRKKQEKEVETLRNPCKQQHALYGLQSPGLATRMQYSVWGRSQWGQSPLGTGLGSIRSQSRSPHVPGVTEGHRMHRLLALAFARPI